MPVERETPEDKLLKVIDNPAAGKKIRGNIFKKNMSYTAELRLWLGSFFKGEKNIKFLKSKIFKNLLIGVGVCLTAFLILDVNMCRVKFEKRFFQINNEATKTSKYLEEKKELRVELDQSLAEAASRNIFTFIMPEKKTREEAQEQPETIISESLKKLSLVGIILTGDSSQAIIEDVENLKTYLVVAGDKIDIFDVFKVQKDSVILKKDKKEWLLQ
ncbi:MAG: hypothetical protein KAS13_08055 [Candidatus Omnitrophica bacterium]|nr:hypothetical protein [Candidatus Omnitrophota bacterium]